jgi:hypothetical protein
LGVIWHICQMLHSSVFDRIKKSIVWRVIGTLCLLIIYAQCLLLRREINAIWDQIVHSKHSVSKKMHFVYITTRLHLFSWFFIEVWISNFLLLCRHLLSPKIFFCYALIFSFSISFSFFNLFLLFISQLFIYLL